MAQVGRAYVQVEGDYRDIADNGAREIEQAFDRVAKTLQFESVEEAFAEAGRKSGDAFTRDAQGRLRDSRGKFVKEGNLLGRTVTKGILAGIDQEGGPGLFARLFGGLQAGAQKIGNSISSNVNPGKLLGGGLTGLLGILGKATAFAGIAGVVYQATSALISLSGVLFTIPGLLASAAVAGGTLAIAFGGIGEAVEALASGDLKKIQAALKDLPPAAQFVAREINALNGVFKTIRRTVQQNFFGQFQGELSRVAANLGGTFNEGFGRVARGLGSFVDDLLEKLQTPKAQNFFERLFDSAEHLVLTVGPPLLDLLGSFGDAFERTLPFVDRVFDALGRGLDKFSGFIDEKVADGSFERFLEKSFETAGLLGDAIGAVIDLLKAMFEDSNETGNEFLETFTDAIRELAEFFESEPGKEALETLVDLGQIFFGIVKLLVASFLGWLLMLHDGLGFWKKIYNTAKAVLGITREISGLGASISRTFASGLAGRARASFAVGGIVDRPMVANIGEDGPEAIIPLTKPARAREVMEEAGLVSIAAGMGASDGTTVIVYLGTEQITDILDTRVEKGLQRASRSVGRERQD